MKEYFIADTHFGHTNIIKYCNRPFDNVSHMDRKLIKKWNNTVSKNDRVYILGDFTLSTNKKQIADYVASLNGQKYLIMGNHDRLTVRQYYECGFDFVSKYPIVVKGFLLLSHEPLFINDNCPYFNIFGHIHNNPTYLTRTQSSWCVCVERQDYKPITFAEGMGNNT